VFYCRSGSRSALAAQAFAAAGFEAHNLDGGLKAWVKDGLPIEPADGHVA
jgi:rhodanese-related sulfurtransferase